MMEATTDLTELLQTLRRALEELYGERLHQVILMDPTHAAKLQKILTSM